MYLPQPPGWFYNLDHIQTDDFIWPCERDESGPDFFFYDISWVEFCNGVPDLAALADETNITVRDLPTLRQAMETIFKNLSKETFRRYMRQTQNVEEIQKLLDDADHHRLGEA